MIAIFLQRIKIKYVCGQSYLAMRGLGLTYIFLRKFLFIILSFLNLVMESNCFLLGPPRFLITEGIHFVLYKISTLLSEKKVVVIIYSYIYWLTCCWVTTINFLLGQMLSVKMWINLRIKSVTLWGKNPKKIKK